MPDASAWFRFRRRLAQPVDAASLGVFRIVFGACVAWDAGSRLLSGEVWRQYVAPPFHFHYALGRVPVLPEPWLTAGCVVLAVAGMCLAVGLFARAAGWLVFAGLAYEFLLDATLYLNHAYLMCLFALLLCVVPADRAYALRYAFRGRRAGETPQVPFGGVFLLRAQMLVVYFFAGVAKINGDWLRGAPLDAWLADQSGFPLIGPWIAQPWLIVGLAWLSMLFDLAIGPLLLFRRTRGVAVALAGTFHLCNHFWFDIGVFPFLAFAATLNFLRTDWPRRVGAAVSRATGFPAGPAVAIGSPSPGAAGSPVPVPGRLAAVVVIWVAVQALVPLRHWIYPGDVNWTEEGHYFSWRMMLRDKGYELHSFSIVRAAPPALADAAASAQPEDPGSRHPRVETWELQPVADPVSPLFPLPLPLQAVLSPEWSSAVEGSPLDQLVAGFLSEGERRALQLDARGDGQPLRPELDRALTHRGLYMAVQHARRTAGTHRGELTANLRQAFQESARELFGAVGLSLPADELDRLLDGEQRLHRLRLTGYQAGKMLVHPELLRQYAHHVAAELESVWRRRPRVFVDVRVALNFRPFAPLVAREVDLASQPFALGHAEWIEPLDVPLPTFHERRQRRELLEQQGYFRE